LDLLALSVSSPQKAARRRRKWTVRFMSPVMGKRREMGLGLLSDVSLAEARDRARDVAKLVKDGRDPIEERNAPKPLAARVPTFEEVAAIVIAAAPAKSKNAKVKYSWGLLLGPAYCAPLLARPVDTITTLDIAALLRPIWTKKPEMARKLRPAIHAIFEAARIVLLDEHGKTMSNPATWADLKALGFKAPPTSTRGHYPSLPYAQIVMKE
jgi:hypothetical protein